MADPVEAGILRGVLEANGIPVAILDRSDSSYPFVIQGEIDVYVPPIWRNLAVEVMSRSLMN